MKRLILLLLLSVSLFAQTTPPQLPATLPSWGAFGATFNQTADPKANAWLSGAWPVAEKIGGYLLGTVDLTPRIVGSGKALTVTFQTGYRLEYVNQMYPLPGKPPSKFTFLVGTGPALFVSSTGNNISTGGGVSFLGIPVLHLKGNWSITVPIRGQKSALSPDWQVAPSIGVIYDLRSFGK